MILPASKRLSGLAFNGLNGAIYTVRKPL